MPFNHILAAELARGDDRDQAPFFAGRDAEIRAFEEAVHDAGRKDQALFRIYQGPPGCGKTSLAAHLAKTRSDNILFVTCEVWDLADADALSRRIKRAALARGGAFARTAALIAETVGEHLGLRTAADAAADRLAVRSARDTTLVLHMDEAHARAPRVGDMLVGLHTTGIGVPCVMMMTGLGQTRSVVTAIHGLSRLARNATVEMGAMTEQECAESTLMMLDALGVDGATPEHEALAGLTGELAHEWPQHLHCAQVSLCEELLRTDGALREVDTRQVRERSDAMRHAYYDLRLDYAPFRIDRPTTRRILVEIARRDVRGDIELEGVCAGAIERAGLSEPFANRGTTPLLFADALIDKGIVRENKGLWRVAIPSMADWAAERNISGGDIA